MKLKLATEFASCDAPFSGFNFNQDLKCFVITGFDDTHAAFKLDFSE